MKAPAPYFLAARGISPHLHAASYLGRSSVSLQQRDHEIPGIPGVTRRGGDYVVRLRV